MGETYAVRVGPDGQLAAFQSLADRAYVRVYGRGIAVTYGPKVGTKSLFSAIWTPR